MELSVVSTLSLFETTKDERASFVNQMVTAIQEGNADPMKVHLQIKCMEQLIEDLKSRPEYKDAVLEEAAKYGKKFEHYNAEWSIRETGVKYDYSNCGDEQYNELQAQKIELDAKIKERSKFLQNIPISGVADPDNGNMIYPPSKNSTTSVIVTLK